MPHIAITMFPGRDDATKADLAKEVKKCVVETLKIDPKVVSVSVEDIERDKWQNNIEKFDGCMFIAPGEE